jgi:hypothetical protein
MSGLLQIGPGWTHFTTATVYLYEVACLLESKQAFADPAQVKQY